MKDKIIDSAANTHKTDAVNTNTTFSTDKAVHTPCYDIPLELIDPNPDNPRKHFGDEGVKQLAATIETLRSDTTRTGTSCPERTDGSYAFYAGSW
ncbi:MAG: hypothetical protein ACLR8Y_15785 [Alistipes indistinctus]